MNIQRRRFSLIAVLFVTLIIASGCGEPPPSESLQKAVLTGEPIWMPVMSWGQAHWIMPLPKALSELQSS